MDRVAVIMSTYNGLKFFGAQIDSILSQVGVEVDLYIRDDGSTDQNFIEKLREYNELDNVMVSFQKNIGVGRSFMSCLYFVPDYYDYYAFSDQDDVWLEDKLVKAIDKISSSRGLVLYASNQYVVDYNLNNKHYRFRNIPGIEAGDIIRGNVISGCTFVMSNQLCCFLKEEFHRPSDDLLKIRIHDVWVAVVASLFGQIVYDQNAYIYYRQHANNVVGAQELLFWDKLKKKAHYLTTSQNSSSRLCAELESVFGNDLGEKRNAINALGCYHKNIFRRLAVIRHWNFYKHKKENLLMYSLKVLLGKI